MHACALAPFFYKCKRESVVCSPLQKFLCSLLAPISLYPHHILFDFLLLQIVRAAYSNPSASTLGVGTPTL